jgi:sigma-B regulation protein RsbU (phosphoserine phosphatase)
MDSPSVLPCVPVALPDDDLQQQLEVAAQVQRSLLPKRHCCFPGWEVGYEYQAAGFVSGDYVDLIPAREGGVHFVLGDVSGKGVGASILMSHLHATLRALLAQELSLEEVLTRTSRTFCKVSLPAQFATLVLGTAHGDGTVEICNAGHVPVLVVKEDGVAPIESTAMPVGMFCNQSFASQTIKVNPGDLLFLYSDGLTEAENAEGESYGEKRLATLLKNGREHAITRLLNRVTLDLNDFAGEKLLDDRSFLVLKRSR